LLGLNVPNPPLQIPVDVGPPTAPDNTVATLFLQIDKSKPASTNGPLVKLIRTVSFA